MKNFIDKLDKAFDNKVRLGIMSILMVNEFVDFKELKQLLNLSDGNLASHIKSLERSKYLETYKSFIGRKPNTKYKATTKGKKAFKLHIEALEKIISGKF